MERCSCCGRIIHDQPSVPKLLEEIFEMLNIPRVVRHERYPSTVSREDWVNIHKRLKEIKVTHEVPA